MIMGDESLLSIALGCMGSQIRAGLCAVSHFVSPRTLNVNWNTETRLFCSYNEECESNGNVDSCFIEVLVPKKDLAQAERWKYMKAISLLSAYG